MMTFNLTFPSLCLTLEPQLVLLYRSFSPETANFLKISMFCYRPKYLLIRELFKEKVKITSSSIVSLLLNDAKKWASIKTQYNGAFPTFGAVSRLRARLLPVGNASGRLHSRQTFHRQCRHYIAIII